MRKGAEGAEGAGRAEDADAEDEEGEDGGCELSISWGSPFWRRRAVLVQSFFSATIKRCYKQETPSFG